MRPADRKIELLHTIRMLVQQVSQIPRVGPGEGNRQQHGSTIAELVPIVGIRETLTGCAGGQHDDQQSSVVFIADDVTIESPEHPILVIDVSPRDGADRRPFRTIPSEVWRIENNLDLANMDWEDFERATDADGVFRGF